MKLIPLAAAALVLLAPVPAVARQGAPSMVGQPAPEIGTSEWIGSEGRTRVSEFKGEVLLLEAFATW